MQVSRFVQRDKVINISNALSVVAVLVLFSSTTSAATVSRFARQADSSDSELRPYHPLLPEDCGLESLGVRIVGGEKTRIDEFPWMSMLHYKNPKNGNIRAACGGMLISRQYVLTAAHCVSGGAYSSSIGNLAWIRFGEYDYTNETDCVKNQGCAPAPLDVGFQEIIIHPSYDDTDSKRYHDIALVRLNQKLPFTKFVKPICLLNKNQRLQKNEKLTVAGWGITENLLASPVKLKLRIPVQSIDTCKMTYMQSRIQIDLEETLQICAGGEAQKDTCKGDSGGPLMRIDITDVVGPRWHAAGIVSFGPRPCGLAGIPSIYTNIPAHVDWILANLKD